MDDHTPRELIFESDLLKIETDGYGTLLRTKEFRKVTLIIGILICCVLILGFGSLILIASHDLLNRQHNWKGDIAGLALGAFGVLLALWGFRESLWGCLPKYLRIDNSGDCTMRRFPFFSRRIPLNKIEAVSLKVGRMPGPASDGYWSCMYLSLVSGKKLRFAILSYGSHSEALKKGNDAITPIGNLLHVPLVHFKK